MEPLNFKKLFDEAVEISNAADSFETLKDFEQTNALVNKMQEVQEHIFNHIMFCTEPLVTNAAAGGNKYADIFEFSGGDITEKFSTLFLVLGGPDRDRLAHLAEHGFSPLMYRLTETVRPFALEHIWNKIDNSNVLRLHWTKIYRETLR
jgi:hypothetical protein